MQGGNRAHEADVGDLQLLLAFTDSAASEAVVAVCPHLDNSIRSNKSETLALMAQNQIFQKNENNDVMVIPKEAMQAEQRTALWEASVSLGKTLRAL